MYDASGPSVWDVMAVDPSIPIDEHVLRLIIRDQRRPSRSLAYPWLRVASRLAVTAIVVGKRIFPVRFSALATMDRLCLWFLRRFVSPDAVRLLIRHFIVETNLLNFCVRNASVSGVPSGARSEEATHGQSRLIKAGQGESRSFKAKTLAEGL